jgi:type III secretion protein J
MRSGRFLLAVMLAVAPSGCRVAIESGMSEEQANRVIVALDRSGIRAVKSVESGAGGGASYAVWVANEDVATALAVLRAEGLPAHPEPGLSEIFGEPSLVPTATEERARLSAALGGELARSIETIDGVLDARVHIALPESGGALLDAPRPRPRASVLVRHRAGRPPSDENAIRALVAGAVPDLDPNDVAVIAVATPEATVEGAHLTSLGPIAVTRGSAPLLRWILGASLGVNLVLAAGIVALLVRQRRAPAPSGETDSSAPNS